MSNKYFDIAMKKVIKQEVNAVLDKIRAEIESQREEASKKHPEDEVSLNYYFGLNDGLKDARDIIDKYKAESEDKE
jgi:beta-glucosidase/6-phospho-beta-glucosidase/beta-galactosidase